jgi:pimeloyl-ACP methyl ester carboxylesterase
MSERQGSRRILRWIAGAFVGLGALIVILLIALLVAAHVVLNTDRVAAGAIQKNVTSNDGTTIAYEQTGTGPAVILVAAALADRGGARRLAERLSEHFTVINYDRRGRGKSGDKQPYAADREVEDIEALIDACDGSAFLSGSSSGSVLALDAASKLGPKINRLFLYEPPLIVDASHPSVPDGLIKEITELTSAGRRNDAVKLFFAKGMGIPNPAVDLMRLFMPGWSKMADMAHTLRYDLTILKGTQTGKSLPAGRWADETAPALIAVGSKSEAFFHHGARALAGMLPNAQYASLEGRDHSAVLLAPEGLASAAERFFLSGSNAKSAQEKRRFRFGIQCGGWAVTDIRNEIAGPCAILMPE